MNNCLQIQFQLLLIVFIVLFGRCTSSRIADGGTEDVNTRVVIGKVLNPDESPASNAQVLLIPSDYDPVRDTGTALLADTTDSIGEYRFAVKDSGNFSAQIVQIEERTRAMVSPEEIFDDTTYFPSAVLSKPGKIKIAIPENVNREKGYVYIPGTDRFIYLNDNSGYAVLDSVPADTIANIVYSEKAEPNVVVLRYNVPVKSDEVSTVSNLSWKYSRALVLNTSVTGASVSGTVFNFPVLIRLTEKNFEFNQAKSDGSDIRFTKPDNTFLPYEIEEWNSTERRAAVWVKVDTVYGDDFIQSINMYWGNSEVLQYSGNSCVFDTSDNVAAVWHLNGECKDATVNNYDAVIVSAHDTAGIIGRCKGFNGSDSVTVAGLLNTPSSLTLSAWVQMGAKSVSRGEDVISIGDAAIIRLDYAQDSVGTTGGIHISENTYFSNVRTGIFLNGTGWHLVSFTIDRDTYENSLYIDGILVGTVSTQKKLVNYTGVGKNTYIGMHGNGKPEYGFNGRIDEVRVYNKPLNPDYIKLSYMNQKSDDALVIFK